VLFETFAQFFWKNDYPRHAVPQLKGKKVKHSLEIIAALAICGPCTVPGIARFTTSNTHIYPHKTVKGSNEASSLGKTYRKLILGRPPQKVGRIVKIKKHPGLINHQFLILTGKIDSERRSAQTYFLTLKGCLFALGFQFTEKQLSLFIQNASHNHLYFAYLNKILEDTSIEFVKKLFIEPVQSLIRNGMLILGETISFSYLLSEQLHAIEKIVFDLVGKYYGLSKRTRKNKSDLVNFDKTLKHTFYTLHPTSDWGDFVKEYFYPDDSSLEYFYLYSDGSIEVSFLYRLMRAVHFGYHSGLTENIPNKTQKIPLSKTWKQYQKFYPELKSPKERDKKKVIVIHY